MGYAIFDKKNNKLTFDLYNLSEKKGTLLDKVYEFVDSLFKDKDIQHVIIERQMKVNMKAMELMHYLQAIIYLKTKDIILFSPRMKFVRLSVPYTTTNKAHKKLSVNLAKSIIEKNYESQLKDFNRFRKKDDISDAILMLFTEMYKNNISQLKI